MTLRRKTILQLQHALGGRSRNQTPFHRTSTNLLAKKGKGKKAQGDNGEDDSHDSTELTSGEESSSDDDEGSEDEFGPSEDDQDGASVEDSESEAELMDSDFLDEDDDYRPGRGKRRESTARNAKPPPKRTKTSAKANGQASSGKKKELKMKIGDHEYIEGYDDEEDDMTDTDLEDGQEIAGRIYPAPKIGANVIQYPLVKYHKTHSIFLRTFKYRNVMIATGLNLMSHLSGKLKRNGNLSSA